VNSAEQLAPLLERADVIAIGPGLGQDEWSTWMVEATLAVSTPTIVDADALNMLARVPRRRVDWILTPHPGEAARLLGWSTAQIQDDRLKAAQEISTRYGGICVLKGAGTIVQREGEVPQICDRGNPGMASAGMGDVLTGVISGVTAQVSHLWDAARVGVLAHAMAGDYAAGRGERGMLATDLFAQLPKCINPLPKF
jgi:NAD(P)H-hydrate epimerase